MSDFTIDETAAARAVCSRYSDAPRFIVWEVLSDLDRWPEWNPSIRSMYLQGPLREGARFDWNAGGLPVRSIVQQFEPDSRIAWTGRSPGIRARHLWHLSDEGPGTRIETAESFSGWLARCFPGTTKRVLNGALEQGIAALAREAERRAYGIRASA